MVSRASLSFAVAWRSPAERRRRDTVRTHVSRALHRLAVVPAVLTTDEYAEMYSALKVLKRTLRYSGLMKAALPSLKGHFGRAVVKMWTVRGDKTPHRQTSRFIMSFNHRRERDPCSGHSERAVALSTP